MAMIIIRTTPTTHPIMIHTVNAITININKFTLNQYTTNPTITDEHLTSTCQASTKQYMSVLKAYLIAWQMQDDQHCFL